MVEWTGVAGGLVSRREVRHFPPRERGGPEKCPDRLSQIAKNPKNDEKTRKMVKKHEKTPKIHAFLVFFGHFWLRTAFGEFFGGVPTKPGFRMASQNAIFAIHSL